MAPIGNKYRHVNSSFGPNSLSRIRRLPASRTQTLNSTAKYQSTVVPTTRPDTIPVLQTNMCQELQTLKREAMCVLRQVKYIRRSRDVSFHEDAELAAKKHKSINAIVKHLLAGHDGKPCPSGDRPIVKLAKAAKSSG